MEAGGWWKEQKRGQRNKERIEIKGSRGGKFCAEKSLQRKLLRDNGGREQNTERGKAWRGKDKVDEKFTRPTSEKRIFNGGF